MGRGRRLAALAALKVAAPAGVRLNVNMEAVARFLWMADESWLSGVRDVFAARLAELGASENPNAVIACPAGLTEKPTFNQRSLYNLSASATLETVPALQAILATVRKRIG